MKQAGGLKGHMGTLRKKVQSGVTLVEMVIAAAIVGLTVASAMLVFRQLVLGVQQSRNQLRADTFLRGRVEELKTSLITASYDGIWDSVTYTPKALAFGLTQVARIDGRELYWVVKTHYGYIDDTGSLVDTTSDTVVTNIVSVRGKAIWNETGATVSLTSAAAAMQTGVLGRYNSVTFTTFVSNYR